MKFSVYKLEKGIGGCYPIRIKGGIESGKSLIPAATLEKTGTSSETSDRTAHPGLRAEPVEQVRHDAEPAEGENDRGRAHESGEIEPSRVDETRQERRDREVDADEHVDIPLQEPSVRLHDVQAGPFSI